MPIIPEPLTDYYNQAAELEKLLHPFQLKYQFRDIRVEGKVVNMEYEWTVKVDIIRNPGYGITIETAFIEVLKPDGEPLFSKEDARSLAAIMLSS